MVGVLCSFGCFMGHPPPLDLAALAAFSGYLPIYTRAHWQPQGASESSQSCKARTLLEIRAGPPRAFTARGSCEARPAGVPPNE